jgi:hypothetical protein
VVKYNLSEIRKTLVGVVGFALTVLATILAWARTSSTRTSSPG